MGRVTLDLNPEFGYELVCAAPYAYWLQSQGKLDKIITCKGMKPFYYFCDDVEERYDIRSIDNQTNGVQNLPNNWIHHNAVALFDKDYSLLTEDEKIQANGVLDYSQWVPPPYADHYKDMKIDLPTKFVVISNRYNKEHGQEPVGYFDIECLYNMFEYFRSAGYDVIYKRPVNKEFATDENEWTNKHITANVEGVGMMNDFELTAHFDNVHLIDNIIEKLDMDYNTSQLKIFARSSGFIAMGGGSSSFSSYFKQPVVIYVNTSKDVRPGYFDKNSYFRKLSNAPIYPIVDKKEDILARGYKNYKLVHETIKKVFK